MYTRLLLVTVLAGLFCASCKRNNSSIVTDYTYAGISTAQWINTITTDSSSTTLAWDSSYQDKLFVHQELQDSSITFTISPQTHLCQSFQESFTFPANALNVYTANASTQQASHTFSIQNDSLTAYMLKYDGIDSNHTTYELSFKGRMVQ